MYSNHTLRKSLAMLGLFAFATLLAPCAQAQSGKTLQAEITALQNQVNALSATVTSQGTSITNLQNTVSSQGAAITNLQNTVSSQATTIASQGTAITTLQGQVSTLNSTVSNLAGVCQYFSLSGNDLIISGANLRIVNGTGQSYTRNGLGNLFLGYNAANYVTGSHNFVSGDQNQMSGCGGIMTGVQNSCSGNNSTILSGDNNVTFGNYVSMLSGIHNNLVSDSSVAISGDTNAASDATDGSILIGGTHNNSFATTGCEINSTYGTINTSSYCTMIGGQDNLFDGAASYSVMCGGVQNHVDSFDSFIGGGSLNTAGAGQCGMIGGYTMTIYPEATYAATGGGNTRGTLVPSLFYAAGTGFYP